VSVQAPPRRVALVVHPTRDVASALDAVADWARADGIDVVQLAVPGSTERALAPNAAPADGDLLVALGGDGTVLAALRAAATVDAPVLGVACGSLGALSAVTTEDLPGVLGRVAAGDWSPRTLPALAVEPDGAPHGWAVNDVVLNRRGAGQLVVDLTVGDELYVRIAGDGLIVATSTGSSAYSMAAGGPILAAGTEAFVCTPVAMHGGSAPPVVVPADVEVTAEVHPGFAGFELEIDGHEQGIESLSYRIALHERRLTLVSFDAGGYGLAALRRRALVTDSPRVLARDAHLHRQAP
jgi:NAD+ kinase